MIDEDKLREQIHRLPCRVLPEIIIMVAKGHDIKDVMAAAEINYENDMITAFRKAGGKV